MVSAAPLCVRLVMKKLRLLAQGANRDRSECSSCGLSRGATVLLIVISTLVSSMILRLGHVAYPAASFTTVTQTSTGGAKRFGMSRESNQIAPFVEKFWTTLPGLHWHRYAPMPVQDFHTAKAMVKELQSLCGSW